jgi:hypothetical protein
MTYVLPIIIVTQMSQLTITDPCCLIEEIEHEENQTEQADSETEAITEATSLGGSSDDDMEDYYSDYEEDE